MKLLEAVLLEVTGTLLERTLAPAAGRVAPAGSGLRPSRNLLLNSLFTGVSVGASGLPKYRNLATATPGLRQLGQVANSSLRSTRLQQSSWKQ